MLKVKQSNEIHHEIKAWKMKATPMETSMQPLIDEALELSTAADTQLKILKEYDMFAQAKASEALASILQEIVEKEQAADDIMRSLNKQFIVFANNILPPDKQQSVPGRDTSDS